MLDCSKLLIPGVTIASGYDIGHGPDISSCVGLTIWNLLKPFRGLKTKADIVGAGNPFIDSWQGDIPRTWS